MFEDQIIYSPLAGCSDFPFRMMAAKYHPDLMFCEMVKMEALLRNIPATYEMLKYCETMRPIGAQIFGSKPELAVASAKIIEDLGFDVIDFNCGCPVDKITKDGSGSGMLKAPEKIGEVLSNIIAAVKIPVTVKVRAGWDDDSIIAPEITKIAEQAGAKAIFVHGRTREQGYKGPANWDFIKLCKAEARHIKVIGNGDIFEPEDALKMKTYTGCDSVLVSRGTMGRPWIAEQIRAVKKGEAPHCRTFEECRLALLEHFNLSVKHKSEKGALIDMRKVSCWYLNKAPNTREFREKASHATSLDEIYHLIDTFRFEI